MTIAIDKKQCVVLNMVWYVLSQIVYFTMNQGSFGSSNVIMTNSSSIESRENICH